MVHAEELLNQELTKIDGQINRVSGWIEQIKDDLVERNLEYQELLSKRSEVKKSLENMKCVERINFRSAAAEGVLSMINSSCQPFTIDNFLSKHVFEMKNVPRMVGKTSFIAQFATEEDIVIAPSSIMAAHIIRLGCKAKVMSRDQIQQKGIKQHARIVWFDDTNMGKTKEELVQYMMMMSHSFKYFVLFGNY